jgi:hypothetical protein
MDSEDFPRLNKEKI